MEPYEFALEAVKEAGALVLELRKVHFDKSIKGGNPRDVLTSVDMAVNALLVEKIRTAFPDHGIYSEEGGGVSSENEYRWTIDPIDGTANFSRGIPHFATCLGLMKGDEIVVGAVFNPVTNELFSFKKGGGAFLNGDPIRTSENTELSRAYVLLHAGRSPENWDWGAASYRALLQHALKTNNPAGSALDVCFVAAGRVEATIYGAFAPADIAGAIGILQEAGGKLVSQEGTPVEMTARAQQRLIAANNDSIIESLRAIL